MDDRGRHTIACGGLTARHNVIRDLLHALAAPVAQPGSLAKEQRLDAGGVSQVVHGGGSQAVHGGADGRQATCPDRTRPGDVTYRLTQQSRLTHVDVTIVGVRLGDGATTRIAARAEADKRRQFASRYQPNADRPRNAGSRADGTNFVPFGMSSFGSFGPSAKAEVSRLMHEYRTQGVELLTDSPHAPLEDVRQKLATAVYASNADAILGARRSLGSLDTGVADVASRDGLRSSIASSFEKESLRLRSYCIETGASPALAIRLLPGVIHPLVQSHTPSAGMASAAAADGVAAPAADRRGSGQSLEARDVGAEHTFDAGSGVVLVARKPLQLSLPNSYPEIGDATFTISQKNSASIAKIVVGWGVDKKEGAAEFARRVNLIRRTADMRPIPPDGDSLIGAGTNPRVSDGAEADVGG